MQCLTKVSLIRVHDRVNLRRNSPKLLGYLNVNKKNTVLSKVIRDSVCFSERVACSQNFAKCACQDGVYEFLAKNFRRQLIHSSGILHKDWLLHYAVAQHCIYQVHCGKAFVNSEVHVLQNLWIHFCRLILYRDITCTQLIITNINLLIKKDILSELYFCFKLNFAIQIFFMRTCLFSLWIHEQRNFKQEYKCSVQV